MANRWIWVDPFTAANGYGDFDCVPPKPGCYVIYCNGQISYVGQSVDVQKRIKSYRLRYGYSNSIFTPWGEFESVTIKYRNDYRYGEWAMDELRLIRRLRPPFNRAGSIKNWRVAA